jgi:nucleotide-binding universal stress UspA family protein
LSHSILVAVNDSLSSRGAVDFLAKMPIGSKESHIALIHILRKPSASEELMGKKFTEEQPKRFLAVLQKAKEKLVESGYTEENIEMELISDPYPTVADGIIDQCMRRNCTMVVLGRKRMSKAEEFVMGDVCIKLVRGLEKVALLVVKTQ